MRGEDTHLSGHNQSLQGYDLGLRVLGPEIDLKVGNGGTESRAMRKNTGKAETGIDVGKQVIESTIYGNRISQVVLRLTVGQGSIRHEALHLVDIHIRLLQDEIDHQQPVVVMGITMTLDLLPQVTIGESLGHPQVSLIYPPHLPHDTLLALVENGPIQGFGL